MDSIFQTCATIMGYMGFVICFQVHWSPIPSCILLGFQFLDRYHPFAGPYAGGGPEVTFKSDSEVVLASWQRQVIVQSPSNSPGFDPFNSNSWSRWLRPLWLINCLDLSQAAVDPTCRIPSSYLSSTSWDFMYTERKQLISDLSVLNCEDVLWRVTLFVTIFTVILTLARRHFRRVKVSALSTDAHPQRIPISVVAAPRNCSRFTFDMAWRHSRNRVRSTVNMSHAHTHTLPPIGFSILQSPLSAKKSCTELHWLLSGYSAILPFTTCHCLCCFAETGSKWKLAEFAARLQCYKSGGRPGRGQTSP